MDVACNDGFVSEYLKREGNTVIGIEVNEELALIAKKRIDEVIVQDIEQAWQVGSGEFDVVHMGYVLEHIFDYNFVLSEASRVLKEGGILVISTPNFAYILHRLELLIGKQPRWYRRVRVIRGWSKGWLREVLQKHGFRPVKWVGTFSTYVPIITPLAKYFPTLSSTLICKSIKEGARNK